MKVNTYRLTKCKCSENNLTCPYAEDQQGTLICTGLRRALKAYGGDSNYLVLPATAGICDTNIVRYRRSYTVEAFTDIIEDYEIKSRSPYYQEAQIRQADYPMEYQIMVTKRW